MESTSNMASIGKRLVSEGAEAIEAVEMLRITGGHCLHRVYNDFLGALMIFPEVFRSRLRTCAYVAKRTGLVLKELTDD